MIKEDFVRLASKVSVGKANEDELRLFNAYFNRFQRENEVWSKMNNEEKEFLRLSLLKRIDAEVDSQHRAFRIKIWQKVVAVAALFIFICLSGLLFRHSIEKRREEEMIAIKPGADKAIITLSNGKVLRLDNATMGQVFAADGLEIKRDSSGTLVYNIVATQQKESDKNPSLYCHTIQTPEGGQIKVNLPDGSLVWLNAASRIVLSPDFISGSERKLDLQGEAYFEVSHDATRPFLVKSKGQLVEVLGTHFNVNAYVDENEVKTTLLEGKVKVNGVFVRPGQQAKLNNGKIYVQTLDEATAEVAWKNGFINLGIQDFRSTMRAIGRWYQVDIVFEDDFDDLHMAGEVSKRRSIKDVLDLIEATGDVKFNIDGKKIFVSRE